MIPSMHVLIAGCGWLGTALARSLVGAGHRVTGIRRDPARARELEALGIEAMALDLCDPGTASRLPARLDWIVACQAAGAEGPDAYRQAYLAANLVLLSHARSCNAKAFVYTGSTGVFGQSDGADVDESTPASPASPTAEILVEAERQVVDFGGRVVRLSGLYGPGRLGVIDRVRTGKLALGPGDDTWTNWCHQEDAVGVVLAALERGRAGATYHGSDAEPLRRRDLVKWVCGKYGFEPHRSTEFSLGRGANRRILSERTRAELGVTLRYPSVRNGLEAALSRTNTD